MAVKIKVRTGAQDPSEPEVIKIKINKKIEYIKLKASKTLDGNIIVSDHPDIQIIIMPKTNKIVALPKDELDDELYDTQSRFYKCLIKKGGVDYNSVQAGNLFMSMEANMVEPADKSDKIEHVLYAIFKFMTRDLPFYRDKDEFEREEEDRQAFD